MNLLLDTSVLLWVLANSPRLREQARDAIQDPDNQVFVSAATAWEIAIKVALGKLSAPRDVAEWLPRRLAYHRFLQLPIAFRHATAVEHLPFHHRDPFDRLLIAQASVERLAVVTADRWFDAYHITVIRC